MSVLSGLKCCCTVFFSFLHWPRVKRFQFSFLLGQPSVKACRSASVQALLSSRIAVYGLSLPLWEKQTLLGLTMGVVSAFCRRNVWWIDCQRGCWQCVLVSSVDRNLMFPMINSASLQQAFWSCGCWGLLDFLLRFFFFFALWHLCANWWWN